MNIKVPTKASVVADIGPSEWESAADRLGCNVFALKAVAEVESRGLGFQADGRATILYEAHIFHRLTKGAYDAALDQHGVRLSVPNWDKSLYGTTADQYPRLIAASKFDWRAAHMACSWGRFQVMGMNYPSLGYTTLDAFLEATDTAAEHLDMFVRFVLVNQLDDELRRYDWKGFARGYNGPGHDKNDYAGKMARAFAKFR